MSSNLVSIIVPVFNSERYIDKCLKSLINQTCGNIEIIVIDDGSIDKSLEIAGNYQIIDSRVKIYSQQNKGPSAARNLGIDKAKGEYVLFVDSDDYVDKFMVEEMVLLAQGKNNVLVLCDNYEVYDNRLEHRKLFCNIKENQVITDTIVMREIASGNAGLVCCKLISLDVIKKNNIRFDESVKMCEDQLFFLSVVQHINHFSYINKPLYYYVRKNENSITLKYQVDAFSNQKYVQKKIEELFIKNKLDGKEDNELLSNRFKSVIWFCINNEISTIKFNNLYKRLLNTYNILLNTNKNDIFINNDSIYSLIDRVLYIGVKSKSPLFATVFFYIIIKFLLPLRQKVIKGTQFLKREKHV